MEVNRRELYRYLGLGSRGPDERTGELAESCLEELSRVISPRSFTRSFPLTFLPDGSMDFSCFTVKSKQLSKNLAGCGEVILFAASLGTGPDLLIRRYSRLEMSRAVVLQAASAAMIEAYCNEVNDEIRKEAERRGQYLRPRFSPGYGDFSLEYQKELCRVLEAEKTVGITLTDSLLMLPSKSVTAVIGAGETPYGCVTEGCGSCGKTDCLYRRGQAEAAD